MNHRSLLPHLVAAAALLAAGLLAGATMRAPAPPVVASVDLEKVYEGLEEQAAADATLEALAARLNEEVEKRRTEIDELRAELESYKPGSQAYQELSQRIELDAINFRSLVELNRNKLEIERARYIRRIYDAVKLALRELGEEQGIDIVFLDDTIPPLESADAARTMQQISARRMLYCNPKLDVTNVLVERMNAAFRARSAGASGG